MKVETDSIAYVAMIPIERAAIVVILYVETFKSDVIVFTSYVTMSLTSPHR